jgi:hypothetical protein
MHFIENNYPTSLQRINIDEGHRYGPTNTSFDQINFKIISLSTSVNTISMHVYYVLSNEWNVKKPKKNWVANAFITQVNTQSMHIVNCTQQHCLSKNLMPWQDIRTRVFRSRGVHCITPPGQKAYISRGPRGAGGGARVELTIICSGGGCDGHAATPGHPCLSEMDSRIDSNVSLHWK